MEVRVTQPCRDLIDGPRGAYNRLGVRLYEASIKCDWKAAKVIVELRPELVRYAITENGETALHVSACSKGHKNTKEFVQNLVKLMSDNDLMLQNLNGKTAFFIAVEAGNITTVKIMLARNNALLTIPGTIKSLMPLYVAVLFGYYDVAKYLYKHSDNLRGDGWDNQNRGWLLEKCVENDMFDIAVQIVDNYSQLAYIKNALGTLARKPQAFSVKRPTLVWGIIISILLFFRLKKRAPENENMAFLLLKKILESISDLPKRAIDDILRGPADVIYRKDKSASKKVIQAIQVQKLVSEHLDKLKDDAEKIINGQPSTSTFENEVDTFSSLTVLISEYLVNLHLETHNVISQHDNNKEVFSKGDEAMQKLISEHIVSLHVDTQNLIKRSSKVDEIPVDLKKLIDNHIKKMREVITIKKTYSSRIIFIAAKTDNTNLLVELIHQYPYLIWKQDDNMQTIFHVAVKHRCVGVFKLLFEIGGMKDLITAIKDDHDNNMLHLAAMSPLQKKTPNVTGVALQMQRELLWFQEVQKMVPPSYGEKRNADNLTPHELFTNEHKDIAKQDEKWMKEIAGQCMVVAALIATMVFTAAFTVPGGYKQENSKHDGFPIFYDETTYKVFVVADAISLLTSTTSILYMFVSVFFSSTYSDSEFLKSLPQRLILGLLYLSVSIISMLIAFCVGFFILYHNDGLLWMPILITTFALIPFYRSIKMFFLLLLDVIRFEYGSRNLFKPNKPILYYKNPRV